MNWGIPYMGSKSKIAPSIAMNFPKADHFYDLFGGGFSISHYMLVNKSKNYKHFHYNEIKADIVELVKQAINGNFNYNKFKPKWISREDFFANLDDAYTRICWSFGNNQKNYLFGDCEQEKKSLHNAVVFNIFDSFMLNELHFSKWPITCKTITDKRLYLKTVLRKIKRIDLQQLERLERLEQLQQLELPKLTLTSKDYRDVEILPNSVVYCDIPYAGTADYGEFSHKEFFDWAATRDFPVYISEYNVPDKRFKLLYDIEKRSMFSVSKDKTTIMTEKLYWNNK